MAQPRREFSPQFKAEWVQFVIETCRPVAEIARELESGEGTLGNWVNQWEQNNPEPEKALTPVERARVAEMEGEIRRLRLDNPGSAVRGLWGVDGAGFLRWDGAFRR